MPANSIWGAGIGGSVSRPPSVARAQMWVVRVAGAASSFALDLPCIEEDLRSLLFTDKRFTIRTQCAGTRTTLQSQSFECGGRLFLGYVGGSWAENSSNNFLDVFGGLPAGMMSGSAETKSRQKLVERAALDLWWNIGKGVDISVCLLQEAATRYRQGGWVQLAEMLLQLSESSGVKVSIPPASFIELLNQHENMVDHACQATSVAAGRFCEAEDDWELVRELFMVVDTNGDGSVSHEELHAAVARFGDDSEMSRALNQLLDGTKPDDAGHLQVSCGEFLQAVRELPRVRGERLQWARTLGLDGEVARQLIPGHVFDGLCGLRHLNESQVEELTAQVLEGLRVSLPVLIVSGIRRLAEGTRTSDNQTNCKFAADRGAMQQQCSFAPLDQFYEGPESLVGFPNPKVDEGIITEHCRRSNAKVAFTAPNYGIETCPAEEYEFVVNPDPRKSYPHCPRDPRRWPPGSGWKGKFGREPMELSLVMAKKEVTQSLLKREEVISIRLYTGPMYVLYNTVLRKFPEHIYSALQGNRYETTLFCIISGVTKLSKNSRIPLNRRLYRGLRDMILPAAFWHVDRANGFRGGVEWSLMSTTSDRNVALQYSGNEKERSTVFEIAIGRVDIGADVSALSQYDNEQEYLFPPLSCLEVVGEPWVDVGVVMVPLRVNMCLKTWTLEQLVERRKTLHLTMVKNIREELEYSAKDQLLQAQLDEAQIYFSVVDLLGEFDQVQDKHASLGAEKYNLDERYKVLLAEALDAKFQLLKKQQAGLDLRKFQATDVEVQRCARAPFSEFYSRDPSASWSASSKTVSSQLFIHREMAPSLTAVLWSAVLKPGSIVTHVKLGTTEIHATLIRHHALSLKALGLQLDINGAAAAGLVLASPIVHLDVRDLEFLERSRVWMARAISECTTLETLNDLSVRNSPDKNLKLAVEHKKSGWFGSRGSVELKKLDLLEWAFVVMKIKHMGWKALQMGSGCLEAKAAKDWSPALAQLSGIQSLDIGNNSIGAAGAASLSKALAHLTTLQKIDLSYNFFGLNGAIRLSSALVRLLSLRSLDLRNNDLKAEGTAALHLALARLTNLEFLDISCNSVGGDGVAWLSRALSHLVVLQILNISDNGLGVVGAMDFTPALSHLVNLRSLDLSNNELGMEGAAWLSLALTRVVNLETLDLRGNYRLGSASWELLLDSLRMLTALTSLNGLAFKNLLGQGPVYISVLLDGVQSCTTTETELLMKKLGICSIEKIKLCQKALELHGVCDLAMLLGRPDISNAVKELELMSNSLEAVGSMALAPALARLHNLNLLNLRDNNIGAEGMAALSPALGQLINLRTLDLRENCIGAGGTALSLSLVHLTNLHAIYLGSNAIGEEGAMAVLSSVLTNLAELHLLELEKNDLRAIGATAFSPALARLTNLQDLYLAENSLGVEGASALSKALVQLTRLQNLDLCPGNHLGDEGAMYVAAALLSMASLKDLHILSGNRVGKDGATALRRAARPCLKHIF